MTEEGICRKFRDNEEVCDDNEQCVSEQCSLDDYTCYSCESRCAARDKLDCTGSLDCPGKCALIKKGRGKKAKFTCLYKPN